MISYVTVLALSRTGCDGGSFGNRTGSVRQEPSRQHRAEKKPDARLSNVCRGLETTDTLEAFARCGNP